VVGDGSTRLSVEVYDENGNLFAYDAGAVCGVSWLPIWTVSFTVKVTNMGGSYNTYALRSN
jgi:hypothetical protein